MAGLANDSMVVVAPAFWVLFGAGWGMMGRKRHGSPSDAVMHSESQGMPKVQAVRKKRWRP